MAEKIKINFSTIITNIEELNPSFDKGVIKIAYHGLNRNGSDIAKNVFNKALPTLINCPVVGHYMREKTDEDGKVGDFGGHDYHVEINGNDIQYVIDTYPIGLVNESAKQWWEIVQEKDGQIHEYLVTECLLWKRQEGYNKIKDCGKLNHSMEIMVEDGEFNDKGVFVIKDFYFEALTILSNSVTPCFESSSISVFSFDKDKFKQDYEQMISDLKKYSYKEKEEILMNEKLQLFSKFSNLTDEDVAELKSNIETYSLEELESKLSEMSKAKEKSEYDLKVDDLNQKLTEKDSEISSLKEEFKVKDEQIFNLNSELIALKENYSKLETETVELKEYKLNTESAKSLAEKETVFEEYSIGLTEEEMQDIREKINEYSVGDIKSQLNEKLTAKTLAELKSRKKEEKQQDTFAIAINQKDGNKSKYAV